MSFPCWCNAGSAGKAIAKVRKKSHPHEKSSLFAGTFLFGNIFASSPFFASFTIVAG